MLLLGILLLLCLLFLLVRWLYDHLWNRGLSCRLSFRDEYAVESEISALTEVLSNHKLLPLPVVEIDFHMDKRLRFADGKNSSVSDQSYRRDVFALAPHQRITRTLEFQCTGRGYFRIEQAGITALNLFLTRKYLTSQVQFTEFYVLPRPVPTAQISIPFSQIMGILLSRKKIYDDPFEFAGLREYSLGDPMKYINWKATARAGELLTNLHESTLSQTVTILVDMEGVGARSADWLNEAAVRIACSLAERLLLSGIELNLYSNGRDVLAGDQWKLEHVSGAGSLLPVKKKFACLQARNDLPPICSCLPEAVPARRSGEEGSLLVLVSKSQRPEDLKIFAELTGKEKGVYIIPYKSEHDQLPAPETIDLIWMEV